MNENEIATLIVDSAFKIHSHLGPGLLESAYQEIMLYELRKRGLRVVSEVTVPIEYEGFQVEAGYRADIIVEGLVIIELKSVEEVMKVHKKQLLTYLRLSNLRLGFLINFGVPLIKNGIYRIVNGLNEIEQQQLTPRARRTQS